MYNGASVYKGRQKTAGFIEVLERASLLAEGSRLRGNYWIFQKDNAAINKADRKFFSKLFLWQRM